MCTLALAVTSVAQQGALQTAAATLGGAYAWNVAAAAPNAPAGAAAPKKRSWAEPDAFSPPAQGYSFRNFTLLIA